MPLINEAGAGECRFSPVPVSVEVVIGSGMQVDVPCPRFLRSGGGSIIEAGKRGEGRGLGLVGGGLVFFDCRQRNLGCACSRVPAEDSDGERAHHKENQAGRG